MKRDIFEKLKAWKASKRRKPLILKGARQVGKTYILEHFAQTAYENYVCINFEEQKIAANLFEKDLDPRRIVADLALLTKSVINPETTLIVFDEVQQCPNALNSLKYFYERANEYHVVAAGSLLGVALADSSFPVGKVNLMQLYPMTFFEYLQAQGKQQWRQYLEGLSNFEPINEALHQELLYEVKRYMVVGGMPEAVSTYIETQNFIEVREVQKEIIDTYLLDFSKHIGKSDAIKVTALWENIPNQLAKDNKKFVFSNVNKNARARDYLTALQWLINAGLIIKVAQVSVPRLPLPSYHDATHCKIYLHDTGLLACLSDLPPEVILHGDELFTEFKGAFTENYAAQALQSAESRDLYYWTSEGRAEVDFLLSMQGKIYPLEVKSGMGKRKKSLLEYDKQYCPPILSRASPHNFIVNDRLCNYPLYAVSLFPALYLEK